MTDVANAAANATGEEPVLEVSHLSKTFPGVHALDDVSLSIKTGEVHALVGENGAGKSTLIKMISGYDVPDSGDIAIAGEHFSHLTPRQAIELGIGTIYQDANLVEDLSVAENVYMGDFPRRGPLIDYAKLRKMTSDLLDELGMDLPVGTPVRELNISQHQFVAVARAVARKVRVLIMDEPTAALSEADTELLFSLVKRLKEKGTSVIYITHRMGEVFRIADRISVMRDGRMITTTTPDAVSSEKLVSLIAGRTISSVYPERAVTPGDVVLRVKGLSGPGVKDVSFELRKGEILGLTGLMGSGAPQVARMLFGAEEHDGGTIELDGKALELNSPGGAVRQGLGYVPADRKGQALLEGRGVAENISLASVRNLSRFGVLDRRREGSMVQRYVSSLGIKTPSTKQLVKNLSGGNQQKVALGKWLARESNVLLLDEPTQGVDVGARHEIYETINRLTSEGVSIILISSDLEELVGMSDRIVIMREGTVAKTVVNDGTVTQEDVLSVASGVAS